MITGMVVRSIVLVKNQIMSEVFSMAYKETTEKYEGETNTYWLTYEVPSKGTGPCR